MWREIVGEIKAGPNVFLHGPEFWLIFPWILWAVFIFIMFGGKRK